jgi:hypothetical protein
MFRDALAAPGRLAFLAITSAIVWFVGSHAIFWVMQALFALASNPQRINEGSIAYGERLLGLGLAYIWCALVCSVHAESALLENAGRATNVNPMIITLLAPRWLLGLFFFPLIAIMLAVLPLYLVYLAVLCVVRFTPLFLPLEREARGGQGGVIDFATVHSAPRRR